MGDSFLGIALPAAATAFSTAAFTPPTLLLLPPPPFAWLPLSRATFFPAVPASPPRAPRATAAEPTAAPAARAAPNLPWAEETFEGTTPAVGLLMSEVPAAGRAEAEEEAVEEEGKERPVGLAASEWGFE